MNRKTLVPAAVIGLLAPVLAACGGPDGGDTSDDAIVVGTTDRFSASGDAPAPFDPAYAYDAGSWNVLRQTVQTLMHLPRGGGEPEPEAAERCGFTDNGNERFECTLRSGLKFSDGSELTADDVKYSIERVLTIKDKNGPSGLLAGIDTVETSGERKVIFHLKAADATFPYKLATPAAGIVNPEAYDAKGLRSGFDVDASGPYTLKTEVEKNTVVKAVFTKNPHYKGNLTPKSDHRIVLRPFDDADSMGDSLKSGDIDLMARGVTPEQIRTLSDDADDKIDVVEMPGLEMRYLGFDTDAPAVRNKAVRQAMAQLVDRGEITSKVYGTAAEPLYSLVPATITGHTNSFFNEYGHPSTAKARALLDKAGVRTPVELTLNYTSDHYGPGTKEEFELLKKQLNASGLFDVDIKGTDWLKFRPSELDGEYAVYGMGWFPDFPDADNFIAPFLGQDNFLASPYANSRIRNTLIPESRQETDRLSAAEPIEDVQDIVARDVPVLPLWQGKQYVAARDDITGVEWALNSSSNMQLWELGRGVGD
ncbi:ABC transporter substrate-binding protein [Streptomyces luteolus]|uniref:ABC transporter substrate-binding protein n=1 Tax=Streptomyces luteolus TaxID=3043615 RepID=A0ABT6STE4_9ACTN|nr:ABC transporter substrate-binding protein [Streptomyces sp. B-S-A12]MDI3418879.1 ABC transporter substrate-binding protein [Streptomyces sp. B-S-A12]